LEGNLCQLFIVQGINIQNIWRAKKLNIRLDVVADTYNPSYLGGRDWETCGSKDTSQKISQVQWLTPVIPATQEVSVGGS
jgi:hypothetical protein